jgi:hypothetical protein
MRYVLAALGSVPSVPEFVRAKTGLEWATRPRDRERASRQNIVATLRLRIKNLEEKNRELTGLLELAYGELALAREKKDSVGAAP